MATTRRTGWMVRAISTSVALVAGGSAWGAGTQPPPASQPASEPLPIVKVESDDTVITQSCRIEIPVGGLIRDANNDGVIIIRTSGITVEFTGPSRLRGAPDRAPSDEMTGIGVRVVGAQNVTLRNMRVSGYKVGLWATNADGLTIENVNASGNFRQRLGSTAEREDPADWLWPHKNDNNEWATNYGAAVKVEDSSDVSISGVLVRRGQNGIILDNVQKSRVFDNDCSYLSGWGLAMWRSSDNVVSRNAFDFCVRGYVHGKYNRGQDSAGILMFEQCSRNIIAENSATHGGDGLFGFAGHEAIGETPAPSEGFDYTRRGCNDNLIINNDFSYAAAHGLEMTFSHGNRIIGNRFAGNAICGIWAGYSQDTLITANTFEENGEGAYGKERGAINIEHGANNRIENNSFARNAVGVRLWADADEALRAKPGVKANYKGSAANIIARNTFEGEPAALELVATTGTVFSNNQLKAVGTPIVADEASPVTEAMPDVPGLAKPSYEAAGVRKPVGARAQMAGRDKIVVGQWGPWDRRQPITRWLGRRSDNRIGVEVLGDVPAVGRTVRGKNMFAETIERADTRQVIVVAGANPGLWPFELLLEGAGLSERYRGVVENFTWEARFFPWTVDPRENYDGWRAQAQSSGARASLAGIDLALGRKGPSALSLSEEVTAAKLAPDRYGMIATAAVPMQAGKWRVRVVSDDGVRVKIGGQTLVDRWTLHAPTEDVAEFTVTDAAPVPMEIEYFQIEGHAALSVRFEWVSVVVPE
ncbi:MAG: right-handed parallel beta-helix repeat-containing protein [Planctomycetota bacterium]|nr:right-handed parallel beta-helix repeat-containing protein [Planctomycetota bacterium]